MDTNQIAQKITGVDLVGKTVVVRKSFFSAQYADGDRRFKCEGGFGCGPSSIGRAVFGTFFDGEDARIDRSDIEGIAVSEL
jgi:hypothetical protein